MAEADESAFLLDPAEPTQSAPCDVLEEDPLDRLRGAEIEDLLECR
jgi:hypothetical protein